MRTHRRHRGRFGLLLILPAVIAACASSRGSAPNSREKADSAGAAYGTPTRIGRGQGERVSRITPQDLERAGNIDLAQFIETRLSGVRVIGDRGQYTVIMTGASFQSNTGALVLVDGTEGSLGGLRTVDISAIEMLKNERAAVYGVRGANGVLLITTKKR